MKAVRLAQWFDDSCNASVVNLVLEEGTTTSRANGRPKDFEAIAELDILLAKRGP